MVNMKKVAVGIVALPYTALLAGAQLYQDFGSEKIMSQKHLDEVIDEEAECLEMRRSPIVGQFYSANDDDYNTIHGARSFIKDVEVEGQMMPLQVLEIKEGYGARRGTVRHELYHLKNHLPREKESVLKEFFYEEPTATIYALTGKEF